MTVKEEIISRITELAAYVETLKSNENTLHSIKPDIAPLIHAIPEPVWFKDKDGKFLFCNAQCELLTGIPQNQILGRTEYDVMDKKLADTFSHQDSIVLAEGEAVHYEDDIVYSNDKHKEVVEITKVPLYDGNNEIIGILAIGHDITRYEKAEIARLFNNFYVESLDKLNTAMQATSKLSTMIDNVLDTVIEIFKCDRAVLSYPLDAEAEVLTKFIERTNANYADIAPLNGPIPSDKQLSALLLSTNEPVEIKNFPQTLQKNPLWKGFAMQVKSLLAIAVYPKKSKPWVFAIHQCSHTRSWTDKEKQLFKEISLRLTNGLSSLLLFQRLKKNESFLSNIVENTPNLIIVKEPEELRYVSINSAAEKAFGINRTDIQGKTAFDLFPAEIAERITRQDQEVLETRKPVWHYDEKIILQTGEVRYCARNSIPMIGADGTINNLLLVIRDITEGKKAQLELEEAREKLRQTQKLDSLGRLAGGIAHDFNNMLGIILGNCDLAAREPETTPKIAAFLNEVMEAALRSAELTKELLAFARKETTQPEVLEPNAAIESMLNMLDTLSEKSISLRWKPQQGVWPIFMDPSQFNRILVNLCLNARDAIKEKGEITITTHNETVEKSHSQLFPDSQPGEYVRLTIADTGSGMDAKMLENIFDPFFTTKGKGEGIGLGLAMVYGSVKQHNGFISVESQVGSGTTFSIYIPRHKTTGETNEERKEQKQNSRGTETILVVDDEEPLLAMISIVLEDLGYTVITASNPFTAIEIAEKLDKQPDLLLSDVIMPGMNGRILADRISSIFPGIALIFMSGYTDEIITHHNIKKESAAFIQKPFLNSALAQKIRETIDNKNM